MILPTVTCPKGIWMLSKIRHVIKLTGLGHLLKKNQVSATLLEFICHDFISRPSDSPIPENAAMTLEKAIEQKMINVEETSKKLRGSTTRILEAI